MYKPNHLSKSKYGARGGTGTRRILPLLFLTFVLISTYMSFGTNRLKNMSMSFMKPFSRIFHVRKECAMQGPKTSAPNNYKDFTINLKLAVDDIIRLKYDTIIYTTVNYEAAKNNLKPFLTSLSSVQPSLSTQIIILCLDLKACEICRAIHVSSLLCIYTDFGVSGDSLAPVNNAKTKDYTYFRLTFGRFYTVYKIMELYSTVSVLSVDVDSVFFKNPFIHGQVLYKNEKMAIVADVKHLNILTKDDTILNGGFIYFPAVNEDAYLLSKEVIDRVWQYNCKYGEQDDQYILSHVLRKIYAERLKLKPVQPSRPTIHQLSKQTVNSNNSDNDKQKLDYDFITYLSTKQYMNYCNTNCGNAKIFSAAYSYQQLLELELNNDNIISDSRKKIDHKQQRQQQPDDSQLFQCTKTGRENWVFFHACCIQWPNNTRTMLSAAKGQVQESMLKWVATTVVVPS